MTDLANFFDFVGRFNDPAGIAIDCAHNLFLVGAVLARKPFNILELGFGSGYVTSSLAHALHYNRRGHLTTVDNWVDFGGREPEGIDQFRKAGVNVVCQDEEQFVRASASDSYDLLVSDADHFHSANWLDQHLRIVQHDGFMFFHDTNSPQSFPGLAALEERLRSLHLPYFHFKDNSRPDERCNRGWLFVINKKIP